MRRNSTDSEHTYENTQDDKIFYPRRISNTSNHQIDHYLPPVIEEADDTDNEESHSSLQPSSKCTKKNILLIMIVVVVILIVLCTCFISIFILKPLLSNVKRTINDTLTLNDGTYVGETFDGRASGDGVLTKWDGQRYVGKFNNNMMDGQGMLYGPRGSNSIEKIYDGTFLENKFDGHGVYYFRDGSRYEGAWKNNQRHGQGKIIYADGRVRNGQWAHDKLIEKVLTYKT